MRITGLGLVLGSFVVSSAALAGTTAEVELGGTVTSTLALSSAPTPAAEELDLMHGHQIVKVADLIMSTNDEQGLTLSVTSGNLVSSLATPIPYQVTTVVAGTLAPDDGAFLVDSGSVYAVSTFGAGGAAKDLYIKYTPAGLQSPGYYGGTITLTVMDN